MEKKNKKLVPVDNNWFDPGYIYMPYVPLQVTPIVLPKLPKLAKKKFKICA